MYQRIEQVAYFYGKPFVNILFDDEKTNILLFQGLRPVTTPLKSSNSPEPGCSDPPKTAIGNIPRNQWTSQALINRSKKGRLILEAFQTSKVLSRKDRIFITHLIVDEFVDEFGKLTREELSLRSAELKCIFPTVEEVIFRKTH